METDEEESEEQRKRERERERAGTWPFSSMGLYPRRMKGREQLR